MNDEVIVKLWKGKKNIKIKNELKKETKFNKIIKLKDIINEIKSNNYQPITSYKLLSVLMDEYENEIGKHAVWRGLITKQFVRWLEDYE